MTSRPPTFRAGHWEQYDSSFLVADAEAYRKDVPAVGAQILDAGRFTLDEQPGEVIRLTGAFMQKLWRQ